MRRLTLLALAGMLPAAPAFAHAGPHSGHVHAIGWTFDASVTAPLLILLVLSGALALGDALFG